MLTPQLLAEAYGRNVGIIGRQAEGLTHAEGLLQPPFRGNCLNWVLGHILESRNTILRVLDAEPALDPAIATRYARGSEPVLGDEPGVAPLEELLRALERSQVQLASRLAGLGAADFEREARFVTRTMPLSDLLFFLYFHECYHTGQTEQLRQLAGRDDKII